MTTITVWMGAAVLVCLALSCGTGSSDFCEAACACQGCSAHEYDHCELDYDARERHAELHGCEDLWADYADCVADERACFDRDYDYYCGPERDRWDNCVSR